MAIISKDSIDRVLSENDIVEVISQYVTLKKAGSSWKGLCPFHAEKTPSFTVSPERGDHGMYHCFGCGVGGNAFKFIMEKENLPFPDAVKVLADRRGIPLNYEGGTASLPTAGRYDSLDWAQALFEKTLWGEHGGPARELLEKRGVKEETARSFRLGYALDNNFLLAAANNATVDAKDLETLGLLVRNEERNTLYDRFRGRLMFPVCNPMGRVVGFGGRAMGAARAKYLNSPESDLFKKNRLLYGLHMARDTIKKSSKALLCEGYMDAIALHQAGFTDAVATLGTAITDNHVRALKRYCSEVVLVYDSDDAGRAATRKAILMLLGEELPCQVVEFGEGEDPDDYITKNGAQAFADKLKNAPDAFEYSLEVALRNRDTSSAKDLTDIVREMAQLLAKMPSTLVRVRRRERMTERLGVGGESELISMVVTPENASRVHAGRLAEVLQVDQKVIEQELVRHGVKVNTSKGRKQQQGGKWKKKTIERGAPAPQETEATDLAELIRQGILGLLLMGYRDEENKRFWSTPEGRGGLEKLVEWFENHRPHQDRVSMLIDQLLPMIQKGEAPDLNRALSSESDDASIVGLAMTAVSSYKTAGKEIEQYVATLISLEREEMTEREHQSLKEREEEQGTLSPDESGESIKKVQNMESERHQYL
jgi:DNA primase